MFEVWVSCTDKCPIPRGERRVHRATSLEIAQESARILTDECHTAELREVDDVNG